MAEPRAETRYAKQLFLYGDGSGAPVRNIARLSKLSGVTDETIRKYLPEWEKEAAQLLASSSEVGLAILLSAEKVASSERDEAFIRDQIDSIKWEIEQLDDLTALLQNLTEKFADDNDMRIEALQIFNAWLNGAGKKSNLRTQFIAMKKLWDEKTGLDGMRDAALTREKEIAKGKAKLEVAKLGNEGALITRNAVAGGVFSRPQRDRAGSIEG